MKKYFIKIAFAVLSMAVSSAAFAAATTIHVGVNGMVCDFCAQGIKKQFSKVDGVESVQVDLDKKDVTIVASDDKQLTDAKIKELLKDAGYDVTGVHRVAKE